MTWKLVAAAASLLIVACNVGSSAGATKSPSLSASPSFSAEPCSAATAYGLLIARGKLELISPAGCVGARASLATPSLRNCAEALPAVLPPPVSASDSQVYFRDGDTKIRYLTPDGKTGDATTVPGSATSISFFSVSPDDQRIAVMVEDMAPTQSINLRLYVEDLSGGGHHTDIYSTTVTKNAGGMTMWPIGWHLGRLVLEVIPVCSVTPVVSPREWRVDNAANGQTLATLPGTSLNIGCASTFFPSPAGVACWTYGAGVLIHDWDGNQVFSGSVEEPYADVLPNMATLFAGRT